MNYYQSKLNTLPGTSYSELIKNARKIYHEIEKSTKRTPYIRSKYFKKQKVFLNLFFDHLKQKSILDRKRRLKFFVCGIDLIKYTPYPPETQQNPNDKSELLHRFSGKSSNGKIFYVQIRENSRKNKFYMSVFPETKKEPRR
jgi:hypothetical protein